MLASGKETAMEHLINPAVKEIQISGIRRFFNQVAKDPNAIQLTIGQPDFPTPDHVKAAGQKAIENNQTAYTPNAGLPELRKAAAQFVAEKHNLHYDPLEEVIVTIGASQAIDITFRTILEAGSEVIIPGPIYPAYEAVIRLCGATPIYIDTTDTQFKLTPERLEKKISKRTRAVVIPYPSNPTGAVLSSDEVKRLAQVLASHELFVVSDEIYSELTYETAHFSIASLPEMRNKTIVINGLSKSHAMTGWRIGFAFVPAPIARHMLKVHQYNVSCASSISQWAALSALTEGKNDAALMRRIYRKRRDYVLERLMGMGMDVVKPEGAFYVFPSIKQYGLSSSQFAIRLLEQEHLAVVPGDSFSSLGEGYIRLSYAYNMDVLEEGLNRLERFITRL
jgi:aminotransferase